MNEHQGENLNVRPTKVCRCLKRKNQNAYKDVFSYLLWTLCVSHGVDIV